MITNYKINQPFTSDLSVEEGEKNSSRTWNHGAGRIVNHVETFFTQKAEKSVEGKPYSRNTESQFVPVWTDFFFLVPFKESRFPLFGISIQAGKRSSRSITERSCATGIDFFYKAQASNFQRRPSSPAANQLGMNAPESFSNLACFNTILYFGKRCRENQREMNRMKPGDL